VTADVAAEPMLTVAGVARRLGVTPQTVERWHWSGYLPADRYAPTLGWRVETVYAFIEASRIEPGTLAHGTVPRKS
jgi:hypothetical protein